MKKDMMRLLQHSYDKILDNRKPITLTTQAATRGEPTSIYASTQLYHSPLLKIIRDLRLGPLTTET